MVECARLKQCCTARCSLVALAVVGAVLVVLGISAQPLIHAVMRSQLRGMVTMEDPSSALFDVWSGNEPIPEYMSYFMFDVQNPKEIMQGAKPEFKLIGPFTYREVNIKSNYTWDADRVRVNYTYTRIFYPVAEMCDGPVVNTDEPPTCTLDDNMNVTVGNAPLMGFIWQIMTAIPNATEIEKDALGLVINFVIEQINKKHKDPKEQEPFFITRPVKEILWGYNDTILSNTYALIEEIRALLPKRAANLTAQSPFIGFQVNNSAPIHTNFSAINTGKGDYTQAFRYEEWAGNEARLNVWKGCDTRDDVGRAYNAQANMINGTEGFQFHALLDEDTLLDVYTQDLQRSAVLYPTVHVEIMGIDLKRYLITPYTLQNSTMHAANCAFDDYGPSGVLNMTRLYNAPVFASKPMFLDADHVYRSLVKMPYEPEFLKHDTFLDIEPWTGAVMHAHQRLQVNLHYAYNPYVYSMVNMSKDGFYLPVFWADEWAYISEKLANDWKDQVGLALDVGKKGQTAGLAAGLSLIGLSLVGAVVMLVRARSAKRGETEPLLGSVNTDF